MSASPPSHPHKARTGLNRLRHALGYSIEGLSSAYRHEKAFQLETWLAVVMLPASFWLGQNWAEIALLAGSVLAVMAAELLNSAIEAAVDRVSLDLHPLSKRAKDQGSACVLLMVVVACGIWGAALWSRFGP